MFIPFWVVGVVLSIVVLVWIATRETSGDYDFFTPMIQFGAFIGLLIFWVAFFIGKYF